MTRHAYTAHEARQFGLVWHMTPADRAARHAYYRAIAERTGARWAWMLAFGYEFIDAISIKNYQED